MSKLYSRIDSLDLTSILSENEAIDKLKESDEKYCKNCFNSFVGEGDICDSCKEVLTEITDVERTALNAVRSIDDRLAIMNCYDITELSYEEQKDLIAEVLNDEFRGWDEELVKVICSEMGLNTEKILNGDIENEAGVDLNLGAKVDLPDDLVSAAGMALLASEDSGNVVTEDSDKENKDAKGDSDIDNKETLKVDDEEKPEEDKVEDIKDKEDDSIDPTEGEDDEDSKSEDDKEKLEEDKDSSEEDVQILIDDLQGRISALKAGLDNLGKLEEVSDKTTFEVDGKEYTKSSAESEIKSLEKDLEKLSKDKNDDMDNAFGDSKLRENEITYTDQVTGEIKPIPSREEYEKDLTKDPNTDSYADNSYEDFINSLVDAGVLTDDQAEKYLTESIMTITTVDNIDQESRDKATIDKAIEIVGDKTTIDNDQFRELRLKLANKDYDVIDRLKDYALVRGEDVIYTWLRAEDSKDNINENVDISIVDNNINISKDDVNINVVINTTTVEPAEDLNAPVEEPTEEPTEEPVEESEEVVFKEGVMIGKDDVSSEELTAIFDNGEANNFTGREWESELYPIYFSDDIWDELDANADKKVSAEAVKDMIRNELSSNTYKTKSATLDSLSQLLGVEAKTEESENLEEDNSVYGTKAELFKKYPELNNVESYQSYSDDDYMAADFDDNGNFKGLRLADKNEETSDEEVNEGEGLQVNDVPAKVDHKRIELAKLESEDKVTYRVSYLKEDDEEIAGWDIEADNDEDAVAALSKFSDVDTIADDLLSAQFISTGIDGISSLNYRNTNILLSTDDNENIITINQDGEDPVIIKGESFDEVMNQLIYWFIMNLDNVEEVPTETPVEDNKTEEGE